MKIAQALWALLKAVPHSYSTILFSDNLLVGLALMGLTFISPIVGLGGLAGLLFALVFSRLLGFEGWESQGGIMAFNSLLISLAIGYYYPYNGIGTLSLPFFGLILTASLITVFLYAGVNYLTQSLFKMPSMSLAFSIAALFFWYYMVRSGLFTGLGFQKPLIWSHSIKLDWFWQDYFLSLGSIVFVPDLIAGILLAIVLFMITRIGFMLSLVGWTICYILLHFSSIGSTYGMFFPGFNLILISLAVGSVFLIPGKSSYLLAAFATLAGFLLAYALSGKYYYSDLMSGRPSFLYLPIFAFPVNVVVIGLIYALRLRVHQKSPIINDYGILHPEKALDAYLSRYRRFSSAGIPQIHLPVNGEWIVTQGHNGEHTHQKDWAMAWDFEIVDAAGKKYSDKDTELRDYYCYGKTVYAAAAGYIAKVVNSIPDNPIGGINTQDNWGNYVTISHGYGFYTLYAHLKEGSVKLAEGDYIKQGEKIGQVGNSGRSPVPHLHFQAQLGIDAGSKTVYSHIINYKKADQDGYQSFVSSGVPLEGELISPLVPEKDLAPILQLGYGQEQSFSVQQGGESYIEHWKVDLDLAGTHSIISDQGSNLEFSIYNGIYNSLSLHGRRRTALAAFAYAASRLPWIENQGLVWQDEPSLSVVMNPFWKNLTLFLIPFFKPIRVSSSSRMSPDKSTITVTTITRLKALGMQVYSYESSLVLDRKHGIRSFSLSQGAKLLIKAEHIEAKEENNA